MIATWRMRALAVAFTLAIAGPAAAQTVDTSAVMARPDLIKQVSDHVWVIPDQSVTGVSNVGFIVGTKAALVVDTDFGPANGKIVYEEAKTLAPGRKLYLVTTHVHPEHDLGAQSFTDATLIRSLDEQRDIVEFGFTTADIFAKRSPAFVELLKGAQFRKADISFDKEYDLDLGGGVKVRIIAMGANHTRGGTAISVAPDRVLFGGDIAMSAQPAFASPYSTVAHWLGALDRFDALKPKVVVPSHGPIGDLGFVAGYRAYLKRIQADVAKDKAAGLSVDDAVKTETEALKYPDAGRLSGAVHAAYAEAK